MAPTKNSSARQLGSGATAREAASVSCVSPNPSKANSAPNTVRACAGWNRIAIWVSACTVVGFAILDHFVLSPNHARITNIVRFGMHVPAVLIMLLLHVEAVLRHAGTSSASAWSRRCSASAS